MSHLVRNERVKLVANALDRASTACLVVGVLAPLTSSALTLAQVAAFLGWIGGALVLHLTARRILGGLLP